jgi:hypothetical protein
MLPAGAGGGERLLRLGEFAFEAAAVFEQGGDAGGDFVGRGLEGGGGGAQRGFAVER